MSLWSNKDSGAITGLVGITGPTFGTLTGTSVAAASTYYNVPQLSVTGTPNASGATFTVTKIGSGTAYAGFTIINAAIPANGGYSASSVIKLSGANLGGVPGAPGTGNDLTIPLTGMPTATLTGASTQFLSELKAGSFLYLGPTTAAATASGTTSSISTTVLTVGGTVTGTFAVGMAVSGGTTAAGTYITSLGTGTGGAGTYNVNISQTVASTTITGTTTTTASGTTSSISGTVLTVGGTVTGTFSVGMAVTGTGVLAGTYITSNTGTSGTYNVNISQSVASTAITGTTQPANKYKILKVDSNTSATLTSLYEAPTFTGGVITRHTAPTHLSLAEARSAVFVSQEEAALAVNKAKGFTGAGWWLHKQYNDASGKPRYKSECLVAITVPETTSFDAPASSGEDLLASDTASVVTLTTSPANKNTSGGTAIFGAELVASASSGTLTYQWQRAFVATPTRFVNINGATSATVTTPGTQTSANTGDQYRVVLSSTNGAPKVTSAPATLTFVS